MLSRTDMARIKYHLDYPLVKFGLDPADTTFSQLIPLEYDLEGVLADLPPENETLILATLDKCDKLENSIVELQCKIVASKVDNIEINPNAIKDMFKLYNYFVDKLIGQVDHRLAWRNSQTTDRNGDRQVRGGGRC